MNTAHEENNLTKEAFLEIMQKYGEAWENFDTGKLLSLFTEDATYQETPFDQPWVGHDGIRQYWEREVVEKQKDVSFTLGDIYIQENVGIVEWVSTFADKETDEKKELRGIILVKVHKGKIQKLWEYWHMQKGS